MSVGFCVGRVGILLIDHVDDDSLSQPPVCDGERLERDQSKDAQDDCASYREHVGSFLPDASVSGALFSFEFS